MDTIRNLSITSNAPVDYYVEILHKVRASIKAGEYTGNGNISRADMVVYHYSYSVKVVD